MEVVFFTNDFAGAMQWADDVTASVRHRETIDALCLVTVYNNPSVVCSITLDNG
ncbi:Unknown protein sequence [Pseudomonas coronafaciens pv. oryzae]|nr:Unknown protein sequence [Pseudomonas coronafaciens pv. oryzae]